MTDLPVVHTSRSLVPGTTMTIPAPATPLRDAECVVVVHRRPGGEVAAVGTVARVEGSAPSSLHDGYVSVTGLHLAEVTPIADRARALPIAEGRVREAAALLGTVTARLRRYMVVSSEAGEGGDVHVSISDDPIVASNQVASLLRVSWPEVQEVLEAGDALDRLERGALVLERETALLEAVIGRSNG